jgi:SRSO17 transposase
VWPSVELLAEHASAGDGPYGFQHLLRTALWDPDAICDELRRHIIQDLAEPDAVLVLNKTGFLKKGLHSAGVARPYSGTAGRVESCQIGVFVADASQHA